MTITVTPIATATVTLQSAPTRASFTEGADTANALILSSTMAAGVRPGGEATDPPLALVLGGHSGLVNGMVTVNPGHDVLLTTDPAVASAGDPLRVFLCPPAVSCTSFSVMGLMAGAKLTMTRATATAGVTF